MKNLRICHISTNQGGGAGIAAIRLHDGLLAQGLDSHFICVYPRNKHKHVHVAQPLTKSKWKKVLQKARLYHTPAQAEQRKVQQIGGKYEIFSAPISDFRPENHPILQDADIIHLHWIANFINYPSFFNKVKKPIVWTLHDMNPFMGGFHYNGDLERNSHNKELQYLDNCYREIKRDALAQNRSLRIITPSKWLYQESKHSAITANYLHSHIPYGLDTNLFKRFPKNMGREVFNLHPDKKMILFVSENVANIRKGFDLLIAAMEKISNKNDFIIVAVGEVDDTAYSLPNLHTIGSIHDERLLPLLYSTADAFLIPSREDNFPNVVIEALACGTPVIGFPIGGITDAVIDGFNGILCDDVSASALSKAIEKFLDTPSFDHRKIAADCVNKYALHIQAKKYMELYTEVLQNNVTSNV
jgi:glycosyltransferase involved in cell wall biosynthesis